MGVEPCVSHVDTLKMYDNHSNFHNNDSKILHGVERNEGGAIIFSNLVYKNSNEKDEDDSKCSIEEKVISNLEKELEIASLHEVYLIAQSPA